MAALEPHGKARHLPRKSSTALFPWITTRTISNDDYSWVPTSPASQAFTYEGRNQDAALASTSGYDANANEITSQDAARSFTYDLENRLLTASGGSAGLTLTYDPLGRLHTAVVGGSTTTEFLYDGDNLAAEYDGSGNVLRRYVHGAGTDEPLVWYEGSGLSDRRWLHADYEGSIVAVSDGSGVSENLYHYGPYGEPVDTSDWGGSRFRYTGQIALPEAQLYHYKARVYDPIFGRFLQTDPVGYKDDTNLYGYVHEDPLDGRDFGGTETCGKFCQFNASIYDAEIALADRLDTLNGTLAGIPEAGPLLGDLAKGGAGILRVLTLTLGKKRRPARQLQGPKFRLPRQKLLQ